MTKETKPTFESEYEELCAKHNKELKALLSVDGMFTDNIILGGKRIVAGITTVEITKEEKNIKE